MNLIPLTLGIDLDAPRRAAPLYGVTQVKPSNQIEPFLNYSTIMECDPLTVLANSLGFVLYFFSGLSDDIENKLESTNSTVSWSWQINNQI